MNLLTIREIDYIQSATDDLMIVVNRYDREIIVLFHIGSFESSVSSAKNLIADFLVVH